MANSDVKPILTLNQISKFYGPTEVLHGIDLNIFAGEVVALLGENGAGKSTLSNIISGAVLPSSGEMTWLKSPYRPVNPKTALEVGVGMIHQELRLLPHLTIAENVFVGRYPKKYGCINRKSMEEKAYQGLQRLGLDISPNRLVEGLSTANQQLIEIAKALTLNVKLLILDEPTASLGGEETKLLFKQIDRLKSEGVGIVYISHRLEEIRQVADRVVVLRDGAKVQEYGSGDIPVREIVESMVGRSLDRMFPNISKPQDDVILQIKNVTALDGSFQNISFDVKKGEIYGIAGLVGSGRTEMVRAITGADTLKNGNVFLNGRDVTPRSPRDSIRNGIILVPEDRKLQGLILEHSIAENIGYANKHSIAKMFMITKRKILKFAEKNIKKFGVKGLGYQNVEELSGGNQQKVVLAKWLACDPKVVILDEPTRGIDVGARWSIYEIVVELAEKGVAVIVVSSDLEEILGVSNRILVMAQGKQAGILEKENATKVSVIELATS